jgi:hypothetical protein
MGVKYTPLEIGLSLAMFIIFQHIGICFRNFFKGLGRAYGRYGTFITMRAQVLINLQVKAAVSKGTAAAYTFAAAYAAFCYNVVLIKGGLYKGTIDSFGRAYLVFCCSIKLQSIGFMVPAA